eukprot:gene13587-biopygen8662
MRRRRSHAHQRCATAIFACVACLLLRWYLLVYSRDDDDDDDDDDDCEEEGCGDDDDDDGDAAAAAAADDDDELLQRYAMLDCLEQGSTTLSMEIQTGVGKYSLEWGSIAWSREVQP